MIYWIVFHFIKRLRQSIELISYKSLPSFKMSSIFYATVLCNAPVVGTIEYAGIISDVLLLLLFIYLL